MNLQTTKQSTLPNQFNSIVAGTNQKRDVSIRPMTLQIRSPHPPTKANDSHLLTPNKIKQSPNLLKKAMVYRTASPNRTRNDLKKDYAYNLNKSVSKDSESLYLLTTHQSFDFGGALDISINMLGKEEHPKGKQLKQQTRKIQHLYDPKPMTTFKPNLPSLKITNYGNKTPNHNNLMNRINTGKKCGTQILQSLFGKTEDAFVPYNKRLESLSPSRTNKEFFDDTINPENSTLFHKEKDGKIFVNKSIEVNSNPRLKLTIEPANNSQKSSARSFEQSPRRIEKRKNSTDSKGNNRDSLSVDKLRKSGDNIFLTRSLHKNSMKMVLKPNESFDMVTAIVNLRSKRDQNNESLISITSSREKLDKRLFLSMDTKENIEAKSKKTKALNNHSNLVPSKNIQKERATSQQKPKKSPYFKLYQRLGTPTKARQRKPSNDNWVLGILPKVEKAPLKNSQKYKGILQKTPSKMKKLSRESFFF